MAARRSTPEERAKQKAYRDNEPARLRQREHQLRYNYGLTLQEFERLTALQRGKCAVCGDALRFEMKKAHVDHDHDTGQVRGILCSDCNLAEGHLRGSAVRARRLAMYLEKHAPKLRIAQ